jgi:hypothetical protein
VGQGGQVRGHQGTVTRNFGWHSINLVRRIPASRTGSLGALVTAHFLFGCATGFKSGAAFGAAGAVADVGVALAGWLRTLGPGRGLTGCCGWFFKIDMVVLL